MVIVWRNDRFELDGRDVYENREAVKTHGFRWDVDKKVWFCPGASQRLTGLRSLQPTISPEAKLRFEEFEVARIANIEASRATDADADIPCPAGLSYLGYQRAGILFALRVFGDL